MAERLFLDFKSSKDRIKYKKQCEVFLKEHGIKELKRCFAECVQREKYEQCEILKGIIDNFSDKQNG